ncbi:MAG: helix-turn-helix transcriptional regulator [Clostridia bacterium]|nr:helix-turn-helix transcriptional regulator [Clostridia bacterium]
MITSKEIQIKLAEEIRNSRISQTELAKKLNIKQPTVAQYLSGKALPALDTFANLCKILDLNPAEILCINDD